MRRWPQERGSDVPISYSKTVMSGVQTKFLAGRNSKCTRLQIRFKVCRVTTADPGVLGVAFRGPSNEHWDLPLNLNNSFYFPSYITTLVRLFDYFYINAAVIEYESRSITVNDSSFVMAYVQDPAWFEAKGQLSTGGAYPSEDAVTSLSNACTNVAYRNCKVSANVDRNVKYFASGDDLSGLVNYGLAHAADMRQNTAGSFMIQGSKGTMGDGVLLGDLYMFLDVELCELSLATTSPVTLASSDKKLPEDIKVRSSSRK